MAVLQESRTLAVLGASGLSSKVLSDTLKIVVKYERDVGEALAAVGHARTAALIDPEPARLDAYAVPGGPAWENDRDLLRRLTDEGFAFSGLEVTVEQAGPARRAGDDALRVDAVLRTSAHTVLDRAGRVAAHREATAEEVVLVLRSGHGEGPEGRDGGAAGRTWRVETVDPR